MRPAHSRLCVALLPLLSLLGCATQRPETAEAGAVVEPQKPPRQFEHKATNEDSLGTLPEGIGLPVGALAPDAQVTSSDGAPISLSSLYAEGPILLVFYRGGWCPFCNFQIRELTEAYGDFRARGVRPVAISVDRIEEAARTDATYEIPFPLLSDPDLSAHNAFHVLNTMDEKTIRRLSLMGLDVESYSGQDHHTVAIPALFVISESGTLLWTHADHDYKTRPTIEQLLGAIESLGLSGIQ